MVSRALYTISRRASLSVPLYMLLYGSAVLVSNIVLLSLYGSLPCRGVRSHYTASAVLNSDSSGRAAISCCLNKEQGRPGQRL